MAVLPLPTERTVALTITANGSLSRSFELLRFQWTYSRLTVEVAIPELARLVCLTVSHKARMLDMGEEPQEAQKAQEL